MVGSSVHGALLEVQQRINQRIMKRNNSSAEDMVISLLPVLKRYLLHLLSSTDPGSYFEYLFAQNAEF